MRRIRKLKNTMRKEYEEEEEDSEESDTEEEKEGGLSAVSKKVAQLGKGKGDDISHQKL